MNIVNSTIRATSVAGAPVLTASLLVGVAAVAAAGTARADSVFDTPSRAYPLGAEQHGGTTIPSGHAVADLNGNGHLDIVHGSFSGTIAPGARGFSIVFNNGDGTYAPPVFHPTPAGLTSSVVAADLNGNGHLDLALTQNETVTGQSILVFFNNGDGTFGPENVFPTSRAPREIRAADMNGDGHLDLVLVSYWIDEVVSVHLNNGGGGFANRQDFPLGQRPRHMRVADVNSDGFPDVLISFETGFWSLGVMLNDGNGGLLPAVGYQMPGYSQAVAADFAVGDVNGSGHADVVYGGGFAPGFMAHATFLANTGDGTFASGVLVETYLSFIASRLVLADLIPPGGDGNLDLAMIGTTFGSHGMVVLAGTGNGSFTNAQHFITGRDPIDLSIADVTGNDRPDVIVTNRSNRAVTVHENREGGLWMPAKHPVDQFVERVAVADVNGNGHLDVVTAYSTSFKTLLNQGDGSFNLVSQNVSLSCMNAIELGDLDGDGFPDLMMLKHNNCPPYQFYTTLGNGDGTFGPITTWAINSAGGNDMAVGDITNSGHLDVIITESLGCPSCETRIFIFLEGKGDGTFEPPVSVTAPPYNMVRAVLGDFNNDGNLDVAGTAGGTGGALIVLGDGQGNFGSPIPHLIQFPPVWMAVGDMNNNGTLDLAYTSDGLQPMGGVTGVLLGNGDGSFTHAGYRWGPYTQGFNATAGIGVLDADQDGKLDVVVSNRHAGDIVLFPGNGDGTLGPQQRYSVNGEIGQPRVADMDGNGLADIVVAAWDYPPIGNGNVTILYGAGVVTIPGDLNGDGVVGVADLLILLANWGACPNCNNCPADLDGDCSVGVADLLILLANWG